MNGTLDTLKNAIKVLQRDPDITNTAFGEDELEEQLRIDSMQRRKDEPPRRTAMRDGGGGGDQSGFNSNMGGGQNNMGGGSNNMGGGGSNMGGSQMQQQPIR